MIGSSRRASPIYAVLPEPHMTAYALSLLDKSPIARGETPTEALRRTVELARHAESWGYRRYWLAEHHNTKSARLPFAGNPDRLIILARTNRIRVGSGGVMLQHYSPYKVAENFNLLASLAPGRVDLGIGKAPGGLPLSTRALQSARDRAQARFRCARVRAGPLSRRCSRRESRTRCCRRRRAVRFRAASHAAAAFACAPFSAPEQASRARRLRRGLAGTSCTRLTSTARRTRSSARWSRYRAASNGRKALLALSVIAAESADEAARLASDTRRFRVQVGDQQPVTVGSIAQAEEFVRQAGGGAHRIDERENHIVHGTSDAVHDALSELQDRYGVDEFIIDNPVTEAAQRVASVRLLARGLQHGKTREAARSGARLKRLSNSITYRVSRISHDGMHAPCRRGLRSELHAQA